MSRFSLSFDKVAAKQVDDLAEKRGLSKSEVVRRAIALYDAVISEGGERPNLTLTTEAGVEKKLVGL